MNKLTILVLMLTLVSCGSAIIKRSYDGDRAYYDFTDRFDVFWDHAHDKEHSEQVQLWKKYVEGRYTDFYNKGIWGSEHLPHWRENKSIHLWVNFQLYKFNADSIIKNTKSLQPRVQRSINSYLKRHPDLNFDINVFIVPAGFAQPTAAVTQYPVSNKLQKYMFVNSDILGASPQNIEKVMEHELTHLDHFERRIRANMSNLVAQNLFDLHMLLYIEGIASHRATLKYKKDFISSIKGEDEIVKRIKEEKKKNKVMIKVAKLNSKNVCHYKLKGYENETLPFACHDLYKVGEDFAKELSKKYKYPQVLTLDSKVVKREVKRYLQERNDKISKSMLKFL